MDDTARPSDSEAAPPVPDTRPRRLHAVPPSTDVAQAPAAPQPQPEAVAQSPHPITAAIQNAAHRMMDTIAEPKDMEGRKFFMFALPERFADWLVRRARAHGQTPEHHAAGLIRAAWQNDEWRLKQEATLTQPGAGAGSFKR